VYLGYKLVGDLFGAIGLVGVGMAVARRYITKKRRLQWDVRWEDQVIIGLLGFLLGVGLAGPLETMRPAPSAEMMASLADSATDRKLVLDYLASLDSPH